MKFHRRALLTGAAGCLSLPLLEAFYAKADDQSAFPRRLVLFYNPNGTVGEHWYPDATGVPSQFELKAIHQPLAAYKDRMTLFTGVNSPVAQHPTNNGGPHQRGIGALFTGQLLLEGQFQDGCGRQAGWADGISVDQLVAAHIGADTPFRSLELGVRANSNDVQGRICYAESGAPLPPINDPRSLYERLFGRSEPINPNDPNIRAASVLDTVHEQFQALYPKLSLADRQKLEKHLSLVQDLERRMTVSGMGGNQGARPECEMPLLPAELDPDSESTMPVVSRAQLDLLAAAFACDLTRVASVQYSTGFNRIRYPWIDESGEGHSLSHSGDSNQKAWDALTQRATWQAGEIAYFLDRLAQIPEGAGSVLDNTLVLWGNEISRGNSHSLDNIPYLMIGTAGGAVRGGQHLVYDGASNCDLLHAVAAAFDIDVPSFGHPEYSSGILSGVLS